MTNEKKDPKQPEEVKLTAPQLYNKLLKDNKLTAFLSQPNIRQINGGGLIIDPPQIIVSFTK